jgi:hypothetical protein
VTERPKIAPRTPWRYRQPERALLGVVCLFLSCAWGRSVDDGLASRTEDTRAGASVGWKTMSFIDLVKHSTSKCIIESPNLVRCPDRLQFAGLAKTSVRGNGVRVEFSDARPGKGGMVLFGASDVVLSGIEIGWLGGGARDPTPTAGGRIQSFGNVAVCSDGEAGGALKLDLKLEGERPIGAVSAWKDSVGWPWFQTAVDRPEVYFPQDFVAEFRAGQTKCLPQLAGLTGRRVLVRHYVYANHAFQCVDCQNITVENVRVTSAPGMAFVFGIGGSDLVLRHDKIEPQCAPHCELPEPSVTADGAHFAAVKGNILIEDCDFGWQGDDSINVTGVLIPVRQDSETDGSAQWFRAAEKSALDFSMFAPGNRVLLFDRGLNALGAADILEVVPASLRLRLSNLPAVVGDVLIARSDYLPKKVTIRNNRFHDHRARGILMGGSDASIEANVIERVTMEAVLVFANTVEGPGAQHVTIRRNRISDVNRYTDARNYPCAISAGVDLDSDYAGSVGSTIRDIVVEENSFAHLYSNSDRPVCFGRGVVAGVIGSNRISP